MAEFEFNLKLLWISSRKAWKKLTGEESELQEGRHDAECVEAVMLDGDVAVEVLHHWH